MVTVGLHGVADAPGGHLELDNGAAGVDPGDGRGTACPVSPGGGRDGHDRGQRVAAAPGRDRQVCPPPGSASWSRARAARTRDRSPSGPWRSPSSDCVGILVRHVDVRGPEVVHGVFTADRPGRVRLEDRSLGSTNVLSWMISGVPRPGQDAAGDQALFHRVGEQVAGSLAGIDVQARDAQAWSW